MSPLVRLQRLSLAAAGISVAAFFASLTVLLWWKAPPLLNQSQEAMWNLSLTGYTANQTLNAVNAPCVGFHGSVTCGPLAQLSQTEKNIGILAGQGTEQIKQSAKLVDSASTAVTGVAGALQTTSAKLNDSADALTGLLHAGTGTVTQAQADLVTLNDSLAATKPLIMHSDLAVQHFDALVSSKDLADAISNVQATTQNIAGVTLDARKAADKATEDYLSPKPWYRKIGRLAVDTYDYGALLARHIP